MVGGVGSRGELEVVLFLVGGGVGVRWSAMRGSMMICWG